MISDKRMTFLNRSGDVDFYLFCPTVFRMYYDDGERDQWPTHQELFSHKLHQLIYMLNGGYRILYAVKDDSVIGYLVFSRGGDRVVRSTSIDDIYTIFIWTYPKYRGKGYGNALVHELLHDADVTYKRAYKTIYSDNIASITVANNNGYRRSFPVQRTRLFHTAYRNEKVDHYYLYVYEGERDS